MSQSSLLQLVEIIILAVTALTTVAVGFLVARQTSRHFRLLRSEHFIERFNSDEMVRIRQSVDNWFNRNADRASDPEDGVDREDPCILVESPEGRTFANFFQELGTALKHKTIDEQYSWDVFGALVDRYWTAFQPHVGELRRLRQRPTLYQEFEYLARHMARIDRRYVRS